jgi:hypothetical protein
MKSFKQLTAATILGFASVSATHALTQVFSDSIAYTWTNSLGTNELTLSQFDGALGTLDSVTLTISYDVPEQDLEIDNDSDGTATGDFNFGEFGGSVFSSSASTFDGSGIVGASDFGYATQTSSYSLLANVNDSTATFDTQPGEDDYFIFTTTEAVFDVVTNISSFVFGEWTGTGDVTIDLAKSYASNITNNVLTGTGTLRQASTQTTGNFSAEVVYNYTPVPETSAFALLGGLCALGFTALRRRR